MSKTIGKELSLNKPKPETKTLTYYDYHDCAEYIESILGYDLRDTLGKFKNGCHDEVEYRDFWHYLVDCGLSNGTMINIPEVSDMNEDWINDIIKVFHQEFGEDAEYLVEW